METRRKMKLSTSDKSAFRVWLCGSGDFCTCDTHSAGLCCGCFFYGSECIEQPGNQFQFLKTGHWMHIEECLKMK